MTAGNVSLSTNIRVNKEEGLISNHSSAHDIYSWKKTREYTTSGKSGIQFGYFTASCQNSVLVEIDQIMLDIPFRTGYMPNRWKIGINCMIPKKVDSLQAINLRTVLLFEADCNHMFKNVLI
jgi:hypothetical protein